MVSLGRSWLYGRRHDALLRHVCPLDGWVCLPPRDQSYYWSDSGRIQRQELLALGRHCPYQDAVLVDGLCWRRVAIFVGGLAAELVIVVVAIVKDFL